VSVEGLDVNGLVESEECKLTNSTSCVSAPSRTPSLGPNDKRPESCDGR
jgi:hypothetical protein